MNREDDEIQEAFLAEWTRMHGEKKRWKKRKQARRRARKKNTSERRINER